MKIYAATKLAKPLGYLHFGYLSAQQNRIESVYNAMDATAKDINEAFASQSAQLSSAMDGVKTAFQHSLIALVIPAIIFPLSLFYLSLTDWDKRRKITVSAAIAVVVVAYYIGIFGLASNRLGLPPSQAQAKIEARQIIEDGAYDRYRGLP